MNIQNATLLYLPAKDEPHKWINLNYVAETMTKSRDPYEADASITLHMITKEKIEVTGSREIRAILEWIASHEIDTKP